MRSLALVSCLSVLMAGCGGGGTMQTSPTPKPDPAPVDTAILTSTADTARFVAAYRDALSNAAQVQVLRMEATMAADSSSPSGFTTTYTQETNVDEHDVVKYDGQYLYIAPSGHSGCCFVATDGLALAADIAPLPAPNDSRDIRILATDPDNASANEISTLPVPDNIFIEGLYHHDQRLSTIGTSAWWGTYGDNFARLEPWANQFTQVDIYDTTTIQSPTKVASIGVEGSLVNTRRTQDGIHLITRHSPEIDGYIYYPSSEAEKAANQSLINGLSSDDLLPKIQRNGVTINGPSLAQCYFNNPNSSAYRAFNYFPTITTVTTIDPLDGNINDSFCFVGYSDGIYINEGDLVITQNYYGDGNDSGVFVHQFSLSDDNHYEGSARLEGRLYLNGNQDFRISRYGDVLRLVTSEWTDNNEDRLDHRLYMLNANATNKALQTLAVLPNAQRPDEIGKPNEDLYGVRFLGDRAYLVTFERIDPLYVLDLSNPSDPFIAGSLEIPGFSNFLHPVTDNLLLGLGQSAERQVKLALFDVSDMTTPILRQEMLVGTDLSWASSEAEYDRHAFAYLAGAENDRFAIPVAGWDETNQKHRQQLHLFDLIGKTSPTNAYLASPGFLKVNNLNNNEHPSHRNRTVLHDDAVYFINGSRVYSAFWQTPINQLGPQ
jgi:hypothetical protein